MWTGARFGRSVTSVRIGAGNASGSHTFVYTPGEYTGTPFDLWTEGSSGEHSHDMDHNHDMDHTHTMPKHKHEFKVTIPATEITSHIHQQIYGIHEVNSNVSNLIIKIDDVEVPFNGTEGEIDITDYLKKDDNGKVTRGYHKIEVTPNDFARINLILTTIFFVRSHIGGTF